MTQRSKIALITGGSQGLGKNMALRLAERGNDLIITYNSNKEEADKVVQQIQEKGQNAAAFKLNVGESRNFDSFFKEITAYLLEKYGSDKFDFLINNAGVGADTLIANTEEEVLDNLYNIHVKGVYFLTQKALPLMNDNGRIVMLSSGLTRFTSMGRSAYAVMKGAIDVFTKYLAKEVGARGITANAVAPGLIQTNFTKASFENEKVLDIIRANTALGRTATPDDIGGVVAFLCSDDARWITGQRIEASGGMFI